MGAFATACAAPLTAGVLAKPGPFGFARGISEYELVVTGTLWRTIVCRTVRWMITWWVTVRRTVWVTAVRLAP
jgi:hypothetical protein